MSNRSDLELSLDVRSFEQVVVLAPDDSAEKRTYPDHWVRPTTATQLQEAVIMQNSVVIVDRVDVNMRTLSTIGQGNVRLVAFIPQDREQEIAMRRLVTATYPWTRTWDHATASGKAIVFEGIVGQAYDRDRILDMRSVEAA